MLTRIITVASVVLAVAPNVTTSLRAPSSPPTAPAQSQTTVVLSKHGCKLKFTYDFSGTGANATAAFTVTMEHNGFFAFGFSADDRGLMNGSYAVIAKAPEKRSQRGEHNLHMAEYSIGGNSESAITRQPTQNLLNPTLTQTGGVTTTGSTILQFSRLLQTGDAADHVIDRDGANTVVWACGGTNTFRKHETVGAMHLNWTTGGEPLPEDAPLEMPIWLWAGLFVVFGFLVPKWIAVKESNQKQAVLDTEKRQAAQQKKANDLKSVASVAVLETKGGPSRAPPVSLPRHTWAGCQKSVTLNLKAFSAKADAALQHPDPKRN